MKILMASVFLFCSILVSHCISGGVVPTLDCYFPEKFANTQSATIPYLTSVQSVCKYQYFMVLPFFGGYAVDADSKSNVVYDIKILKPDGSIYLLEKDLIAKQREIPADNNTYLPDGIMKVCFEAPDPYGTYKIYVTLRDLVSKREVDLNTKIKLVKTKYKKVSFNDKKFGELMPEYYKNPQPEKLISSYLYYAGSKLTENESGLMPCLAFYVSAFNQNEYLIPLVYDIYPRQSDKVKVLLLLLLNYLKHDSSEFIAKLPEKERNVFADMQKEAEEINFDKSNLTIVNQLDMLWAEFYSTGSYDCVKSLVNAMDYVQYTGSEDKYEASAKTEEDKSNATREMIYKAAFWSVRIHYHTHSLVRDYCDFMYQNGNLSDNAKAELEKIINEKPGGN